MRSLAIAAFLSICFTSLGNARAATEPGDTWAWACTLRDRGAVTCEGSFGVTIPLPSLHDESGALMTDALRGTALIMQTIAKGTETGFRGTETGFISLSEIAAGTETGFRYFLLLESTCRVSMSLDGRVRPSQTSCDETESRIVARRR
jgi:hypothetical protein